MIGMRWLTFALMAGTAVAAVPAAAAPSTCKASTSDGARPWLDRRFSPACRAKLVLASFGSLDEKLAVLVAPRGARGGRWLTERGLPELRGGDGPAGIRNGGVSVTSFPTPLSMAASFDPETAALYGRTLASEFADFGLRRMGGPALDVARTWNFGRVTESLGEDPYLIGVMGAHEVRAIQDRGVMSMVKHFAVYTQEQGRAGDHPLRTRPAVNAILSERVMREIYLPGFERAVIDGGAGQVMCSFPRINGTYACEHPLLLGILKNEWKFDGMVVPDFPDAQRSIVAAVNAGLDSGYMVSAPPAADAAGSLATATDNTFGGEDLRTAVRDGKVSPARIDDLLLRRLIAEFRVGTFDAPTRAPSGDVSTDARREIAADLVARGTVLLKNDRGVLPFSRSVRTVAVIGHQAGPAAVVAELGSAHVAPMHLAAVLPAMRTRGGDAVRIAYAQGTLGLDRLPLIPTGMVRTDGQAGFRTEYFDNPDLDFSGTPFLVRQEASVDNSVIPATDFPKNRAWSARWNGTFTPIETGIQNFTLAGSGTATFYIAGRKVGAFSNADFADTIYANIPMQAGVPADLRVEWTPRVTFRQAAVDDFGTTLGPAVRLGWAGPNRLIADAVAAARQADVAVVFVGHRVGEGMDRLSLALPNDQDALIEAVAAANPNTVVVLQTGGAVTMPWLGKVAAVMEMWLPGDAFGPAAAQLLFGDVEPGGRLPVTFPATEDQGPARKKEQYPGSPSEAGAVDQARFDEGLNVGYRYWDAMGQVPLFPFGHGLSYTKFDMQVGRVRRTREGGATIDVRVRNTGARTGSDVVQAYVGFPASAEEPSRQLKAFEKVTLGPGVTRSIRLNLDARAFQYWDQGERRWKAAAGEYSIMIGRSSRDASKTVRVEY